MKTRSTADNGNNLRVIRHSGSEENNGDENQNRHKGENQIQNPKWIKIKQEKRPLTLRSFLFVVLLTNKATLRAIIPI